MKADVVNHKSIVADENYFETENLGQIVDIDSHLDFLKSVSEKYIHKKEDKKNIQNSLRCCMYSFCSVLSISQYRRFGEPR